MKRPHDFFDIYRQSAWERDAARMVALYDQEVLIFDMWAHGYQRGLQAWGAEINARLASLGEEKVRVIFEAVEVSEGSGLAFGSALVTYQAVAGDGTVLRSMRNRMTVGFALSEGMWKVVHQHTSAPLDSELKAILDFY
jgi:ketosteroid isomerase-like protein